METILPSSKQSAAPIHMNLDHHSKDADDATKNSQHGEQKQDTVNEKEYCIEPGIIEVLIPNFTDDSSTSSLPYTLPSPIPTRSYSPSHYDSQRPVFVDRHLQTHPSHEEALSLSVKAFEPYIRHSKPVKISHFMSFRHSNINQQQEKESQEQHNSNFLIPFIHSQNDPTEWCHENHKHKVDAMLNATRFPVHLLDTQVQVLCKCIPKTFTLQQQSSSDHKTRKRKISESHASKIVESDSTSIMDDTQVELYSKYLSVVDPDQQMMDPNPTPTFLGQENSVSTTLSLEDTFYQTFDSTKTLQVYMAQQSLLSCRSSYPQTTFISCLLDGRLEYPSGYTPDDTEDTPLAALAPYIRAPSYLLSPSMAQILEVNLWYSPFQCCTNYHYDSNHNLLMVLSGTKTIELAPPDVIRPAALYSDHANHPALLHTPATTTTTTSSSMPPLDECVETRKRLLEKSFVVSVSAGEALFIPAGWWHRVESSHFCMAINIWFDHPYRSVASLHDPKNSHMISFHIRELTRTYFEQQKRQVAQHLIELDKHVWIHRLEQEYRMEAIFISNIETLLRTSSSSNEVLDLRTWLSSENLTLSILSTKFNMLLLFLDPDNINHRSIAINLLDDVYHLCSTSPNHVPINELILAVESSSCYILSTIWENHDKKIVQESCSLLFERCNEKSDACLRHVVKGAEEFNRRIMTNLYQTMSIT